MSIRLWHFTSPENADAILASEFKDGEFGYAYFAPSGDTSYKDLSRPTLVEVILDVADEELLRKAYKKISVDRYIKQSGPLLKIEDPAEYREKITYDIPSSFLKAHMVAIRIVPPAEFS